MKQSNLFLRAKTLAVAGLSLFLTGCLTPALWKESDLVDHFKPASDARVQLFAKPDHTGVLVLYDETREERDSVRRRAFFLKPNEIKLQERERPQFTNPAAAAKLQPVPLIGRDATGTNAPPDQLQVRLSEDGHRFTLLERGEERGAYDLPVYLLTHTRMVVLSSSLSNVLIPTNNYDTHILPILQRAARMR